MHYCLRPKYLTEKLSDTVTPIVDSCMLNSKDVCCFPPQGGLYCSRGQDTKERPSSIDPGINRGVTDLYLSRGYKPRKARVGSIKLRLQS